MKAKDLIKILEKNPEAEVRLGEPVTEYVSNVDDVKVCNVEEDYGTFRTKAVVLIAGFETLVYSKD